MFHQPDQRTSLFTETRAARVSWKLLYIQMHDIACETAVRGGQICITLLRTLPEGTLASAVRALLSKFTPYTLCMHPPPLLANLPPLFLPHRRNRHFTYVYNVPLQATTAHSPSLTVQSHDDKSDSTPTSDSRFVCAVCSALVNQWVPLFQALAILAQKEWKTAVRRIQHVLSCKTQIMIIMYPYFTTVHTNLKHITCYENIITIMQ